MSDWKLPRRQRRWEARLRGLPYRSSVSNQPHYVKMYFITQFLPDSTREAVYPMRAQQLAAVEIQRVARGRGLRQRFKNFDWNSMEPRERIKKARQLSRPPLLQVAIPDSQPNSMLSKYLQFVRVRESARVELPAFAGGGFAVWCAARIQAWWRMLKEKWHFTLLRFRMYHIASQQIQFMVKSYLRIGPEQAEIEKKEKEKKLKRQQQRRKALKVPKFEGIRDEAAYKIQSLWWRHANRRVYKYFRDLIQFRLCGNPASLLRTINPREASLFDKATGIHVRFRLGGHSFPPTLYYKVFLLNPLCDVGSFAPRDYAYVNKQTINEQQTKYNNNILTSKIHDFGTDRSFNGRVSSPLSTSSMCEYANDDNMNNNRESHHRSSRNHQRNNMSLSFNGKSNEMSRPGSTNNYHQRHLRQPYAVSSSTSQKQQQPPQYAPPPPSSPMMKSQSSSQMLKRSGKTMTSSSSAMFSGQQEQSFQRRDKETGSVQGQIRVGTSYFGTTMDHLGPEGTSNWYKRVENNGWRAVTGKKAHEAASLEYNNPNNQGRRNNNEKELPDAPRGAYVINENNCESMPFHYSRLKRKEDKKKTRKLKKRDWLKHMYEEGLAKERNEQNNEQDKQQGHNNHFKKDINNHFPNNNEQKDGERKGMKKDHDILDFDDDEFGIDDELLTWSKNLDYDHYVANWHVLATSGTSGNNYHVPTNKANTHEMVPEPDWVTLKKQFDA